MSRWSRVAIGVVVVLLWLPLATVLLRSFSTRNYSIELGTGRAYARLWDSEPRTALLTTFAIGLAVTVLATVVATAAIVAMIVTDVVSRVPLWMFVIPVVVPDLFVAAAWNVGYATFRIEQGFATVVLAQAAFGIAYGMLLLLPAARSSSRERIAIARSLGAGRMRTMTQVVLPILFPHIRVVGALVFLLSVDDFAIALLTAGPGVQPATIYLWSTLRRGFSPLLFAMSSVLTATITTLAIVSQLILRKET